MLSRNGSKRRCCSLPKKKTRETGYEVSCPKGKLEQEGEGSCGKVCEEGLPKAKLEQEGEGSAKKVQQKTPKSENLEYMTENDTKCSEIYVSRQISAFCFYLE